jgi:hypothetical protein
MTLHIDYESDGFPVGCEVTNGPRRLQVSWNDLLWSALTVGRPNRHYVFRHGESSTYEALFRLSLVRLALEQSSPSGRVLRRTNAARSLDPTEKGVVNYFLGMAVAKLFAAECLDVPWMLHLDVFRPRLNAVLSGRSRPDLIGQDRSGKWVALECKGRLSPPSNDAKAKAKRQAQRVVSIGGQQPAMAIGAVTYFRKETLHFYWCDPEPLREVRNAIEVPAPTPEVWNQYYAPARGLFGAARLERRGEAFWTRLEPADIEIGVHEKVWAALTRGDGSGAREAASSLVNVETHSDGLAVRAGDTWLKPFSEEEEPWLPIEM